MKIKIIIAGFLFLLSVILIGQNLDKPFWGEHDWNGVRYGNIARNYLRYGYWETKLGQTESSGYVGNKEFEYYTHYPPMLPILVSFSYRLFGVSEWSTRLVPLLATSGSIILIFLIGAQVWSMRVGILASLLVLATPMVLYFGKNPVHEPVTLFFILLAFFGYLSALKGKKYGKIIFILGLILAEMTAWAGYFLIPAVTIIIFIRHDKKGFKGILPYWILSFIIFLIHVGYVYSVTGMISGGNIFESLMQRSGISPAVQPQGFNFLNYISRIRLWFSTLFTLTLTLVSATWVISRGITKIDEKDWNIIILGLIGSIYLIVFSNAVFIHNYLIFYFLPFIALASAVSIDTFRNIKFFGRFYLIIAAFLIFLAAFERRSFLLALDESRGDKLAYDVGEAIHRQTNPSDIVLVSPLKFSYSADKFLRFYSDRKLTYSEEGKFDVKVLVDMDTGKFEIIKK